MSFILHTLLWRISDDDDDDDDDRLTFMNQKTFKHPFTLITTS